MELADVSARSAEDLLRLAVLMLGASLLTLPCKDPGVWLMAVLITVLQTLAMRFVLLKRRLWHVNYWGALLCVQFSSWVVVIGFWSWVLSHGKWLTDIGLLVLWLITIPLEYSLLRLLSAGFKEPMTPARAAATSVGGALVRTAAIFGLVAWSWCSMPS